MSQFRELEEKTKGIDLPCSGTNEDGEMIIINHGKDDTGYYFSVSTAQDNGWLRINRYYEDGTITETFDK